ncbi:hypothetical protein Avbf_10088 [Armadillidium vulgare]|nr:hypothetical protein Avbf_10088 [Armadillidium vulgare]
MEITKENVVVCYFTNWAWYRPDIGKFMPDDILTPDLCTHINYAFATLDYSQLIMKPYDTWADIDNGLVTSPSARANFVTNALAFVKQYGFDGIDLDWEYPVCPQNYCNEAMYSGDKDGFTAWTQELKEAFHPEGLLVTAAVSASYQPYDVPAISASLDLINVMTYDFHGSWDRQTGHVSPLYSHPDDVDPYFNTVVCYFTNWAWYRPDIGKYMPENIDPDLCTHINYAFSTLDSEELIMKPYDSWADIDNEFYAKVTAYSQYGVKVLISIGGWNDSAGDKYHRLVTDPAARANFVTNALAFCNQYGFGGIDLDWEVPSLSAAYDVPGISTYLDHINVMTYAYYEASSGKTGHDSPLYAYPGEPDPYFNTNYTINLWINKGADPLKVIMGFPMYGISLTLADPSVNGLNAPTTGCGEAGPYTGACGTLAYYEICYNVEQGWTVVQDPLGNMGPYAYSGDQWVSYDDVAMVQTKSEYVLSMGLGGAMIWSLDLDDFANRCGTEAYPLLKTINRIDR